MIKINNIITRTASELTKGNFPYNAYKMTYGQTDNLSACTLCIATV